MRLTRVIYAILVILATFAGIPSRGQNPLEEAKKAIEKAQQAAKQRQEKQKAAQAAAQAAAAPPVVQPLDAKVWEQLMGPMSQQLVLSEDGSHLALQTTKGSRVVVMVDGVEGPLFDEIMRNMGGPDNQVQLNPSGGRSAYVGRRGAEHIAVVDGKEAGTVSTATTARLAGQASAGWSFFFNQDGSRLAYAVINDTGSWSMMVDGVKGDRFAAFDLKQTVLNGKRLAYVVQTADQKWHLVVDNKTGPAYDSIQSLKMTPDGAHYAFIGIKGGAYAVVLDGVEGKSYPNVADLEMAPDGRIAYQATVSLAAAGPGGNPPHLIVGGLEIPNSVVPFGHPTPTGQTPLHYVAFSPDGKQFAYIRRNTPSPSVTVMVNGKAMGLEYSNAADLMFSPDGSRFAYIGSSAGAAGTFVVVDGQELAGYNLVSDLQFSADKRYAFRGYRSTGPPGTMGIFAVVEGQEPKKFQDVAIWSMTFSPNGKHLAYSAQTTVSSFQAVIDGEVRPGYLGNFAAVNRTNPPINFPLFVYSPDGNRLAYVGPKLDGTAKASVILDGVAHEGITASFSFPSFSPNSKHFAWTLWDGKGWAVMVDGKAGPTYENILDISVAGCRFVDDRTFRYYGIKNGQIYRVTLDLGN